MICHGTLKSSPYFSVYFIYSFLVCLLGHAVTCFCLHRYTFCDLRTHCCSSKWFYTIILVSILLVRLLFLCIFSIRWLIASRGTVFVVGTTRKRATSLLTSGLSMLIDPANATSNVLAFRMHQQSFWRVSAVASSAYTTQLRRLTSAPTSLGPQRCGLVPAGPITVTKI